MGKRAACCALGNDHGVTTAPYEHLGGSFPGKVADMANLIAEGAVRPELNFAYELSTAPPPIITTKPRRPPLTSAALVERNALRGMWDTEDPPNSYLPSPETIAAACRAIQATWSDEEREFRRNGETPQGYQIAKFRKPDSNPQRRRMLERQRAAMESVVTP